MSSHYIIFHPEKERQKIYVEATAILIKKHVKRRVLRTRFRKKNPSRLFNFYQKIRIKNLSCSPIKDRIICKAPRKWWGDIWVDKMQNNEDPFIFSEQWFFSYCHATQLRRSQKKGSHYLTENSTIFFCTGEQASNGFLEFDTVFIVKAGHKWVCPGKTVPVAFAAYQTEKTSDLWKRHLRYGIKSGPSGHAGQYTYSAKMYSAQNFCNEYSFLPLCREMCRVKISINTVSYKLSNKIKNNIKGKYPVRIDDSERDYLLDILKKNTHIMVVGDVRHLDLKPFPK